MSTDTLSSGCFMRGEQVYLAAQDGEKDAAIKASWTRDSEYLRFLDSDPARPRTTQFWRDRSAQAGERDNSFAFAIHALDDGRLIGFVALWIASWPEAQAMVAIGLGAAADRGRGYGTDAMRLALRYAFMELNLERVTLQAYSHNARGLRSYEKAGFVYEGLSREFIKRDGQCYGEINMGILKDDWLAQHER